MARRRLESVLSFDDPFPSRSGLDALIAAACRARPPELAPMLPARSTRSKLRAYAGRAAASRAVWAFLSAIRPLASWRSARWLSSFFDQRIRIPRLRLSQEWVASTTQRRARQPGVRILSAISSPRARMCGVSS